MTKDEKKKIAKAIKLLNEDDGWDEAMKILVKLAGFKPRFELTDKSIDVVSLGKACNFEESDFRIKRK